VSNRGIANLNAKVFAISLERAAGKLGPIVGYDPVRDPKPADDKLDELDD
jgi:hypothetical protein